MKIVIGSFTADSRNGSVSDDYLQKNIASFKMDRWIGISRSRFRGKKIKNEEVKILYY